MTHLGFATDLARQAGVIMKQHFQLGIAKEWKADNTPVTMADRQINQLVLDAAAREYPTYSVIAEEGSRIIDGAEYAWVCDPIDGTIPYSHGIPTSTFVLALTRNGRVEVAVAYDPLLDRLFTAELGRGAFLNGEPIHVSALTNLERGVIAAGSWRQSPYDLTPVITALFDRDVKIMNLLSNVYAAMLVAVGQLAAVVFVGSSPWDSAANKLIVEEAGGRVTDLFGDDPRYDRDVRGSIVSNGLVHDELMALVRAELKGQLPESL